MLKKLRAIFLHDLRLAFRRGGSATSFALASLFALAILLEDSRIAPPLVWLIILLALLPITDQLFAEDCASGICEVILTAPMPLALYAAAKCLAQWTALQPLLLAASLAAFFFFKLDAHNFWTLYPTLLTGSLAALFLGSIAAALTAPLRRSGALTALLALPLYFPLIIFGAAASQENTLLSSPPFLYLLAFTLLTLILAPSAASAALKNSLS